MTQQFTYEDPNNLLEYMEGIAIILENASRRKHSLGPDWQYSHYERFEIRGGNGYLYKVFFDKAEPKAIEWKGQWLTQAEIHNVIDRFNDCNLDIKDLLTGLPSGYASGLPYANSPNVRAISWLNRMNTIHALTNGTIPLLVVLRNASTLSKHLPQGAYFGELIAVKFKEGDT